jgi:hypothetical protein
MFLDDISDSLRKNIPVVWDGRTAILEMKDDGRNWRQMEWIGFYFEYLCRRHLTGILEIPCPRVGNVSFDGFLEIPWDFKAHAINTSTHQIIVNDREAVEWAIKNHGSLGLILALGEVVYNDDKFTFKKWHDKLKGGKSDYEKKRIKRGAWSRKRKTRFDLRQITLLQIKHTTLERCGAFQRGFRNADGSKRREKVLIDLEKMKSEIVRKIDY